MDVNGDPVGIAIGGTLVLAGPCRCAQTWRERPGQWRAGNRLGGSGLQGLQIARGAQAYTGN